MMRKRRWGWSHFYHPSKCCSALNSKGLRGLRAFQWPSAQRGDAEDRLCLTRLTRNTVRERHPISASLSQLLCDTCWPWVMRDGCGAIAVPDAEPQLRWQGRQCPGFSCHLQSPMSVDVQRNGMDFSSSIHISLESIAAFLSSASFPSSCSKDHRLVHSIDQQYLDTTPKHLDRPSFQHARADQDSHCLFLPRDLGGSNVVKGHVDPQDDWWLQVGGLYARISLL